MERNILDFIESHVVAVSPIERKANLALWDYRTSGDPDQQRLHTASRKALKQVYSNREHYARVRTYDEEAVSAQPATQRQLRLMRLRFARNQLPADVIDRLVEQETDVGRTIHTYRVLLDGEKLSFVEVAEILRESNDGDRRKGVWEASMRMGDEIGPDLVRLVGIRNRAARDLDYRDYYHMALDLQELDESQLLETIDSIVEHTETAYRRAKKALDVELSERYRVPQTRLMPWHYSATFLQSAPPQKEVNFDRYYDDKDLPELAASFFRGIGLEVEDIIARSEFSPPTTQPMHPLCLHVDRGSDDIRVLGSLEQGEQSMATILEQLGRAAYLKYLGDDLPYLLRGVAHPSTGEAVATFMGRMSREPEFLTTVAGANKSGVTRAMRGIRERQRLSRLIKARWVAVMVHFEKALYENPGRDLNRIWWELIERNPAHQDSRGPPRTPGLGHHPRARHARREFP